MISLFYKKKINPEDVYNACDRRNLNKSDLERIADNIQIELNKFKIFILANHDKLTNEARYTSEFEDLKKIRNSEISALHDATAILYVKKKRGKNVQDFEKVNSWFVNNSTSYSGEIYSVRNGIQPISIKADDLLNILWLSSPSINSNFSANDLVNIGLTSTISLTLNKNLPKSKVLKDLDDNLCKYAQEEIADEDILRVARRITNKQLIDIEELNSIAESDKEEFIKRLNDEASKQKALEEKTARSIDSVFKAIRSEANKLSQAKREYEELTNDNQSQILGLKEALMISEKKIREIREEEFISSEIKKWRRKSIFECVIFLSILIFIMFIVLKENNYNLDEAYKYYTSHIILSIIVSTLILILNGFALKSLYDKYRNHSNIENYKKNIKIPVVL
ncbi:hypothetical protein [Edaphocola flava]|uniref:hypothetical protein n=1 Tax=Edaphocola flava TaxID=2499629 RepID=UPI00100AC2A5|nr:hypothetical protein [Edaphocola flava]